MNSRIDVSVVLVNWNGLKWLSKCLKSIECQINVKTEIILVDNNSSDLSVEYARRNHPTVKIIQLESNVGFGKGVSAGISNATGQHICVINTDTWAKPDLLSELLTELQGRNLDVIAPQEADYDTSEERNRYISKIDPFGHPIFIYTAKQTSRNFYLSGVCLLFTKELYITSGGFDPDFFMYVEEVDWFWRLNLQNKRIGYSETQKIYHKGSGSTGDGIKSQIFLWRNENTLRMLIKNYSFSSLLIILPMVMLMNFFEALVFLILNKRTFARTYPLAWVAIFRDKHNLLSSHKAIQESKKINDISIIRMMYPWPAKAHHLKYILSTRLSSAKN